MSKQYIDSQEHWEDEINADYDKREQVLKEQPDNRTEEMPTPMQRQVDCVVIPCCALCRHIETTQEYDKVFGDYKSNVCVKFREMARTFPVFEAMWHRDLTVMPKQINNCKHFEEKPKSDIPLFGATSV